jgi:hypothetical protein
MLRTVTWATPVLTPTQAEAEVLGGSYDRSHDGYRPQGCLVLRA